jgi:tetratricopeptide (TPR) repeat protein
MKKIFCTLALVVAASSLSAQDKVVRKARTLKEEVQNLIATQQRNEKQQAELETKLAQAMEMITPTLTSPETKKELANAWDVKAQLHKYTFSPLLDKIIAKEATDTLALYTNVVAALDAMEECYKAELASGKEPVYSKINAIDVARFRQYIAYCGQMFFQNKQYDLAKQAFIRWMQYPETYTIVASDETVTNDENKAQIAYFTCLSSYFAKDYKTLQSYIPQARAYEPEKANVNQLYITSFIEQGDTAQWLSACRELVLEDPNNNEPVAQNVLAYYFNKGQFDTALAFTEELLAKDADSRIGNYSKGLVLMNNKDYRNAITFFDKAAEIDPTFSDAYYNAGVCYSNIGYDINEQLTGKKMTAAQNKAEIEKVKAEYAKAEPYFVKVRELEPDNSDKWASRLRTVYYILGNKAKEKEMSDILGD